MERASLSVETEVASLLRSASVQMCGLQGNALRMFLASLSDWLARYGMWLSHASGLTRSQNLHLIYQRSLTLRDLRDFEPRKEFEVCLKAARAAGMPLTMKLDLAVCVQHSEDVLALMSTGLVNGLVLSQNSPQPFHNYSREQVWTLLRSLKPLVGINFAGNYDYWRECILTPALIDDTAFTLQPTAEMKARRRNCLGAVGCHVFEDGSIFVCERLYGVPSAKLGSIHDRTPFDPMSAPVAAQLREWVVNGPHCTRTLSPHERAEGIMCKLHAEQLMMAA